MVLLIFYLVAGEIFLVITYLAGLLLALTQWRNCPTASRLTAVSMGMMLFMTLICPFFAQRLLFSRGPQATTLDVLEKLVHASAVALLVAAVYQGRVPDTEKAEGPEEHGITEHPSL